MVFTKSFVAVKLEEKVKPAEFVLEEIMFANVCVPAESWTVCAREEEANETVEVPALNVPEVPVQFPLAVMRDELALKIPPFNTKSLDTVTE